MLTVRLTAAYWFFPELFSINHTEFHFLFSTSVRRFTWLIGHYEQISVNNWVISFWRRPPCLTALHSISVLDPAAAGSTSEVPVLGPADVGTPAVWQVCSWDGSEATLHRRHTHGVSALSWETLCWKLALGGFLPILHLGTRNTQ